MGGVVLGGGAVAMAVVENGFELIVVGAAGVELGVEDEPGGGLTLAARHRSRFAGIDGETFFEGDGHDFDFKAGALAGKVLVTGEEQVVGVAGVASTALFGETSEAAIEAEGGEVGQGRGSGRALGKVVATVESALGGGEI